MTPQTPSPPSPPSSTSSSFPILAISLLGILTTTFLLLSYYIFVIKCFLNRQPADGFLGRRLSRSGRYLRSRSLQLMAYVTGAAIESRGLGESVIQAIPTLRYRKAGEDAEKTSTFHECAVCLNEFQEEERIRLLPNCLHTFHIDCIDVWLQTNDNCPLCRSSITASSPLREALLQRPELQPQWSDRDVVIEVGDDGSRERDADPCAMKKEKRARRHAHVSSTGEESIDLAGVAKDELFHVQPMRRSFSMDSSGDRQLRAAVQKVLQQNIPRISEAINAGESSSGSDNSGRFRRQFFSFGRSSRNAVLPVHFKP